MSWKRKSGSKNDERTKWHVVEVSTSVQFTASSTLRVGRMISLEFTSIKINLTSIFSLHGGEESNHRTPHFLWDQIVYGRVRAGGDGGCTSEWSDSSSPWKTTRDCTNDQYLDNQVLSNPSNWSCVTCPQGGACSGPATWSTLGPLFGWWKLPNSVTFTKCLYPPACLGSSNLAFQGQYISEDDIDLAMVGVISGVNATNTTCGIHLGFRNESRLCHTCNSTSRRKE